MGYTTISFLLFVILIAVFYFCFPPKYRWVILLIASYVFYWVCSNWAIIYIITTTVSAFYVGRLLGSDSHFLTKKDDNSNKSDKEIKANRKKIKKRLLVAALLLNFGILAVLKYSGFVTGNINVVLSFLKIGSIPMKSFLLPVGISFYTFQTMGYLIDVYRGKYKPERNIFRFALFSSFFPQTVQGPIGRYDKLSEQLCAPNRFDYERVKNGVLLMAYGFAKKLIIADRAMVLVQSVYDKNISAQYGSIVFFATLVYGLQLYCDFSGGIDISRGVAQIFGIELAQNFRRPYYAQSVSEYWRRWHITLGAWMRDYLFYPVLLSKSFQQLTLRIRKRYGMNWARNIPSAIATFIVFMVVGIWHGASWNYVAFGLWNGIFISTSIILDPFFKKTLAFFKIRTDCFSYRLFARARTLIIMTFMRYFGRSVTFTAALVNFKVTFVQFKIEMLLDGTLLKLGLNKFDYVVILIGITVLILFGIIQEQGRSIRKLLAEQNIWFRWMVYSMLIVIFMLLPVDGQKIVKEFIYARF